MVDQQDKPFLPTKQNLRELDFDILSIARMRQCDQDTKRLIVGVRHEAATSWALLAEISRILAIR